MRMLNHIGPVLSAAEQVELATRAQAGDAAAENMLVERNLKLIRRLVNPWIKMVRPCDAEDLVQAGAIGLHNAIRKYQPHRKIKFMSYAKGWIEQAARVETKRILETIRIPTHIYRVKTKKLQMMAASARNLTTLDYFTDDGCIVERCGDSTTPRDSYIANNELPLRIEKMREMVDLLNDPFRTIIIKRFGIDGEGVRTLETLSHEMGVTHETIRQRQKKALNMLKGMCENA